MTPSLRTYPRFLGLAVGFCCGAAFAISFAFAIGFALGIAFALGAGWAFAMGLACGRGTIVFAFPHPCAKHGVFDTICVNLRLSQEVIPVVGAFE